MLFLKNARVRHRNKEQINFTRKQMRTGQPMLSPTPVLSPLACVIRTVLFILQTSDVIVGEHTGTLLTPPSPSPMETSPQHSRTVAITATHGKTGIYWEKRFCSRIRGPEGHFLNLGFLVPKWR